MNDMKDFYEQAEGNEDLLPVVGEVMTKEDESIEDEDLNPIIKFSKPYFFEGVEYTQLDLSGIENLSASDMIAVNRYMQRTNPGIDVMPEVSLEYAINIASKATKLPIEFFLAMPMKYSMKVKNRVMGFLFGSD